jgi:hypothetical protein
VPRIAAAGPVPTRANVAWALQNSLPMITDTSFWRRLTPETIAELPETGAVFEVANLVRTVQFIGRASGNLRARMAAYVSEDLKLRPCPGGYYFRYERTPAEEETLDQRLAAYLGSHGGMLPLGNAGPQPTLRVAARRAA